jgi:hypothetical protein
LIFLAIFSSRPVLVPSLKNGRLERNSRRQIPVFFPNDELRADPSGETGRYRYQNETGERERIAGWCGPIENGNQAK